MPPALVAAAAAAMAWLAAITESGSTPLRSSPPALPPEEPAAVWPCILDDSPTAAGVTTSGFWSLQAAAWRECLRPLQAGKDFAVSDCSQKWSLCSLQPACCSLRGEHNSSLSSL